MQQTRSLPRHLDMPQRILVFQVDELVPAAVFFMIGLGTGHIVKCVLIAMFSIWLMRRFRDTRPDGYLYHFLYWYGFAPASCRQTLNPFLRRVLPS
jgi:conjugal transfer pilus assembly protein TraL